MADLCYQPHTKQCRLLDREGDLSSVNVPKVFCSEKKVCVEGEFEKENIDSVVSSQVSPFSHPFSSNLSRRKLAGSSGEEGDEPKCYLDLHSFSSTRRCASETILSSHEIGSEWCEGSRTEGADFCSTKDVKESIVDFLSSMMKSLSSHKDPEPIQPEVNSRDREGTYHEREESLVSLPSEKKTASIFSLFQNLEKKKARERTSPQEEETRSQMADRAKNDFYMNQSSEYENIHSWEEPTGKEENEATWSSLSMDSSFSPISETPHPSQKGEDTYRCTGRGRKDHDW